jgi:hypothetical protein
MAKCRALQLLREALTQVDKDPDVDSILATVLMFVQLELIDSGQDSWKAHLDGARKILEMLNLSSRSNITVEMTGLRKCLLANLLVYVASQPSD